jgi:hypothetical protein
VVTIDKGPFLFSLTSNAAHVSTALSSEDPDKDRCRPSNLVWDWSNVYEDSHRSISQYLSKIYNTYDTLPLTLANRTVVQEMPKYQSIDGSISRFGGLIGDIMMSSLVNKAKAICL